MIRTLADRGDKRLVILLYGSKEDDRSPPCRIIESTPGKRWSDICRPDGPGVCVGRRAPGIVPAWLSFAGIHYSGLPHSTKPDRVWNRIPDDIRRCIVMIRICPG